MSYNGSSSLSNWYMVDAADVITTVGASWDWFAHENKGDSAVSDFVVGKSLWTFIDCKETSDFIKSIFKYCRQNKRDFEMFYKCDSQQMSRVFLMRAFIFEDGGIRLVHDLISEEPKAKRGLREVRVSSKQCSQCLAHFDVSLLRANSAWEGYPTDLSNTFVCEDCRNHAELAMH